MLNMQTSLGLHRFKNRRELQRLLGRAWLRVKQRRESGANMLPDAGVYQRALRADRQLTKPTGLTLSCSVVILYSGLFTLRFSKLQVPKFCFPGSDRSERGRPVIVTTHKGQPISPGAVCFRHTRHGRWLSESPPVARKQAYEYF